MALRAQFAEKLYSADEFETLPEFKHGYELVEGKLVKKPMPNSEPSLIARIIIKNYDIFDPQEKVGRMLQEISTGLNLKNTPAPDVAFWKAERKPKRSQKATDYPDLAIEIWSPHDLDTKKRQAEARAKIKRYLEAGVLLVWAINPENQTVEVYRAGEVAPQVLQKDAILSSEAVIPGFQLSLLELFESD
jgi:Uma2 family endonuclease